MECRGEYKCVEICALPQGRRVQIEDFEDEKRVKQSIITRHFSDPMKRRRFISIVVPRSIRNGIQVNPAETACEGVAKIYEYGRLNAGKGDFTRSVTAQCRILREEMWASGGSIKRRTFNRNQKRSKKRRHH